MNCRFTISIVFVFFLLHPLSARYNLVLQRGHSGAPVAIEWHEKSRVLVSVGEDGFLIVTKPEEKIVLHRFRVTWGRISNLDINQSDEKAAIVYFEDGFFILSVWNWASEKLIYEHKFDRELLFAYWSEHGTYLMLGTIGTPSMMLFDGATGQRLAKLQNLPSLYDYGYIGATETILMTYKTSGFIHYWDIDSSQLKHSVKTAPNLRGLCVLKTQSKSILFAYQNDTLILLDRQTGYVLDRLAIVGLIDASIDKETGAVDAIAITANGFVLHRYEIQGNEFAPRGFAGINPSYLQLDVSPAKALQVDGTTYLISRDEFITVESGDSFVALIENNLWQPDSFAFYGDSINIVGGSEILRFTSSFFSSDFGGDISELIDLALEVFFSRSSAEHTGIHIFSDGSFLIWDKYFSGNENGIRRFHPSMPHLEFFCPITDMILKCSLIDDKRIITVDKNGFIKIWNSKNGEMIAEYFSFDNLDAAYSIKGEFLLVGRSSRGIIGTPLELIDMESGETRPVPDKRLMVYIVESEPGNIYTVGIRKSSLNKTETVLFRHDPKRVERSRNLLRVSGEVLGAIVLPHPNDNSVYTNLGGKVVQILGNRTIPYEHEGSIVFLQVHGSKLYGLDRDGSLVVWESNGGMPILKVYFFKDGAWVASSEDDIWASSQALERIVIFEDGIRVEPREICKILGS